MDLKSRRDTLRMFTHGVHVMTSRSEDRYGGATVTWVSHALLPPTSDHGRHSEGQQRVPLLSESSLAAIHVLASTQQDLAQRFFTPTRFSDGQMNGEPLTEGKYVCPNIANGEQIPV